MRRPLAACSLAVLGIGLLLPALPLNAARPPAAGPRPAAPALPLPALERLPPACADGAAPLPTLAPLPAADTAGGHAEQRTALHELVRHAVERSSQVGAARLVADAAVDEVEQARAAKDVQAQAGAGIGPWAGRLPGSNATDAAALRWHASLNAGKLLYDGGRVDRLTEWRLYLADSARQAHRSVREQLTLSAVSLALERSRLRQQAVVHGQTLRRLACVLGEAGEAVGGAASDPDAALAQRWLQQVQLAQAQIQSQARQVELRLRRLAGDGLPLADGAATVLLAVPALEEALRDAERSSEVAVFGAQAAALGRYAQAVAATTQPQVRLSFDGDGANALPPVADPGGRTKSGSFALGLSLNLPVHVPGTQAALEAAWQRARAAELLRLDALEARRLRVAEVHEQTLAAFERVRRVTEVLRGSEEVRRLTLHQWRQGGERSLFDVVAAEAEHLSLRLAHIDALHEGQANNAALLSMGRGLYDWLR